MSQSLPLITILYATETGNAEEIAYILYTKLNISNIRCNVINIKDYNVTNLPEETYIIFIVSTTGDGEVPSDMRIFWNYLLRKSLPVNSLNELNFIIFGLGDSSYEKFNAVARKLEKRLIQLSAIELYSIGLGDDQAIYGYFTALNEWISNVLLILNKQLSNKYYSITKQDSNEKCYNITILDSINKDNTIKDSISHSNDTNNFNSNINNNTIISPIYQAIIYDNIRLTDNNWSQDVRHIKMKVIPSENNATSIDPLYYVGDVVEVYYKNPKLIIDKAINIICDNDTNNTLFEHSRINISYIGINKKRPSRLGNINNCTLYELLERYLDIASIPKRSYFEKLSYYAMNIDEKNKLLELSCAEGTDLYFDYCIRERKNYIEILEEFPSIRSSISLDLLIDLIPIIIPRQYSIASSPLLSHHSIEICVAIMQRRTPYGRKRVGLCSGYLSTVTTNEIIYIRIKRGLIYNTPISTINNNNNNVNNTTINTNKPMILIGPGTGLAPMRALIQHHLLRMSQQQQTNTLVDTNNTIHTNNANNINTTNTLTSQIASQLSTTTVTTTPLIIFYFGCRRKDKDCLYSNEWNLINNDINPYINNNNNNTIFNINPQLITNNHNTTANETTNITDASNISATILDKKVYIDIAFSQEQLIKDYVTHHIIKNGQQLCHLLLDKDANIFISGSSKRMPADVKKAFINILSTYTNMSISDSELYINKLIHLKRYIVEAWS